MLKSLSIGTFKNKVSHSHFNVENSSKKAVACASENNTCPYCKESYAIYNCGSFLAVSASNRYAEEKKHKLCTNCQRNNHAFQNCSSGNCLRCNMKHHALLNVDNYTGGSTSQYKQGNHNSFSSVESVRNGIILNKKQCQLTPSYLSQAAQTISAIKECLKQLVSSFSIKKGQPHQCRAFE